LEAAAAKLLIICTKECNFNALVDKNAGIIIKTGKNGVVDGLNILNSLTENEMEKLKVSSLDLVRESYSWDVVSNNWIETYTKISKR
jgi:glycosyltransferase involved in cell wall biosynthesis